MLQKLRQSLQIQIFRLVVEDKPATTPRTAMNSKDEGPCCHVLKLQAPASRELSLPTPHEMQEVNNARRRVAMAEIRHSC